MRQLLFQGVIIASMLLASFPATAAKEKPWFLFKHKKFGYVIQYPSNWETRTVPKHPDWHWAGDYKGKKKDIDVVGPDAVVKDVRVPLSVIIAADPESTKPGATLTDYATVTRDEILIGIGGAGLRKDFEGMREWPRMSGMRVVGWGAQQEDLRAYGASFIKDDLAYTVVYLTTEKSKFLPNATIKTHLQRSLRSFKFPSPKPLAKTRQYENKQLALRLAYPIVWELEETLPTSVVFTDPDGDSEGGLRANASVAVYMIPKATSMQTIIGSFTNQVKKDPNVYDFKIESQPRFIAFQKYTAASKKVAEMTATFRLADDKDMPRMRSHFLFFALPDRSVVVHDRSIDSKYSSHKVEFDALKQSLVILPKKK